MLSGYRSTLELIEPRPTMTGGLNRTSNGIHRSQISTSTMGLRTSRFFTPQLLGRRAEGEIKLFIKCTYLHNSYVVLLNLIKKD